MMQENYLGENEGRRCQERVLPPSHIISQKAKCKRVDKMRYCDLCLMKEREIKLSFAEKCLFIFAFEKFTERFSYH